MKDSRAIRGLLARNTLPWALLIAAVMAAAEALLWRLRPEAVSPASALEGVPLAPGGAALVALTALLTLRGVWQAKNEWTLRRLRVELRTIRWLRMAQNTVCYLLLWAAQVGLLMLFAAWYTRQHPEAIHENTWYLAFYRAGAAHNLLPMADALGWVRNALFCLSLGALTARDKGLVQNIMWAITVALQIQEFDAATFSVVLAAIVLGAGFFAIQRPEETGEAFAMPLPETTAGAVLQAGVLAATTAHEAQQEDEDEEV